VGAGYWADRWFGTTPWLLLLGGGIGIGTGLWQFYLTVSRK
jgi:F0F1-type ATP synthase assembly protein I